MLEYLVGAATVAVGWSGYLDIFVSGLVGKNHIFDPRWSNAPFVWIEGTPNVTDGFYLNKVKCLDGSSCQAVFNIPAFVIVVAITILLVLGIREAAWVNNTMVIIKLLVTVMFILTGIKFINNANYTPFVPPNEGKGQYGLSGIFEASVSVFFAYIGFDAVTTTAQEAANPQRDLPIGIIGSLGICTILYIAVSSVLVGMVPFRTIDLKAPVGQALIDVGLPAMAVIISFGALVGLTSVMISTMIGQPRIFYSMAYDGLLPPVFAKIHPTFGTPYVTTIFSGIFCALLAGLLPVDILGNLTSVGTLSAFFLVSVSTLVLRITQPDLPRKFQIPGGFWFGGVIVPFLSAFFSAGLFSQATVASIARVFIWMAIGLVIYFSYGFWKSKVGQAIANGGSASDAKYESRGEKDSKA
nr:Cationic amino acid transporter-1 [Polyrhizophydium stewartii]